MVPSGVALGRLRGPGARGRVPTRARRGPGAPAMGLRRLLALALLAWGRGVAAGAEAVGNASQGFLEFSVGKFRYLELSRAPEEAILRDISSNVTFLIFQIHSQSQNTTVSSSPTFLPSSSATGTDGGLAFILTPEQSTCSWYLQTAAAAPVQSVAIPLSYSETGGHNRNLGSMRISHVGGKSPSAWAVLCRLLRCICRQRSQKWSRRDLSWHPSNGMLAWQDVAYLIDGNAGPYFTLLELSIGDNPIPGGCNLEFDLDIDPNIYVEYDFFETTVKFAPANLGYARGAAPPSCDAGTGRDSRWRLQYDVYQYFLPENDLAEKVLLQHLQRMAEVSQVKASAVKVVTLTADDKTEVSFSSIRGQGVIYNVIVRDPFLNSSAAYIPAHTYACSFEAVDGGCASLGRVSTKVFFTLFALLGLFICFFGHRFWKTELFFIGFIFMGFFFYILVARLTPLKYDVRLILTAVAGSVGGLVLAVVWWRFGVLPLCMLCVGLALGSLVASVVLFTPLGNLQVFRNDGVFWVTFSCVAVLVPAVFVGCQRILNILACGVLGSYSVVLAVDSYSYTSLSHITLNVLRRALSPGFRRAFTSVPLQTTDFIVLAVWGMLAVSGITLQIRRERGRPFFPPHPYKLWKQERERRVTNVLDPSYHIPPLRERLSSRLAQIKELFRKEQPAGERTPLLL